MLRRCNIVIKRCCRTYSTRRHDRVAVRCGSTGSVFIDLYNIDNFSSKTPLFIHIPPWPTTGGGDTTAPLPKFTKEYPVASINYRWDNFEEQETDAIQYKKRESKGWPTPVHDVSFSFQWLVENLCRQDRSRQTVYVFGSYLGASLATSLALTETHPHEPFAVRGLVAYNGIYNWTMFLPDHKLNRPTKKSAIMSSPPTPNSAHIQLLSDRLPRLFGEPANMFDAFGSPSLFFHSPGLLQPRSFYQSASDAAAIDALVGDDETASEVKHPRKSHLIFPPRTSTLKIPETLLIHDSVPKGNRATGRRTKSSPKFTTNSFAAQAAELAELMRRSIDVVELKERSKWDDEMELWENEAHRRVQLLDVGEEEQGYDLNDQADAAIDDWLKTRR